MSLRRGLVAQVEVCGAMRNPPTLHRCAVVVVVVAVAVMVEA